jgi:hypothetical protein
MTELAALLSDPTAAAIVLPSFATLALMAAGFSLMLSAIYPPARRFLPRLLALGCFLAIAAALAPGMLR